MAGLKKKKREKSGSPNIVLVIFLVFFIIATITLGVFLYLALDEKSLALRDMAKERTNAQTEKTTATYYRWLTRELRAAVGDKLGEKEIPELAVDREGFAKGGFDKVATDKEATLGVLAIVRDHLNLNETGYEKNYPGQLDLERNKVKDLEGKANTEGKPTPDEKADWALTQKQDQFHQDASDRIAKGSAETIRNQERAGIRQTGKRPDRTRS